MDALVSALRAAQNRDGGWGYRSGSTSWTEPTSLSLLALEEIADAGTSIGPGREWLRRNQRSDGGWAPQPAVDQSTWVTSLSVLSLARSGNKQCVSTGVAWLLAQAGQQATGVERFRAWLLRQKQDRTQPGWSWFPGTASWVIPTATGILALENAAYLVTDTRIEQRISQGREFLFFRQCAGGGWNHGGTPIRSEDARPYPETTGIALLAMKGRDDGLRPALERGELMFRDAESNEGENWLRLGLAAHGRRPDSGPSKTAGPQTTVGLALQLIAAKPHNPFLAERTR